MSGAPQSPRRPRIAIGCIIHETNSFSQRPIRLADFESRYFLTGPDLSGLAGTNGDSHALLRDTCGRGRHRFDAAARVAFPACPAVGLAARTLASAFGVNKHD